MARLIVMSRVPMRLPLGTLVRPGDHSTFTVASYRAELHEHVLWYYPMQAVHSMIDTRFR